MSDKALTDAQWRVRFFRKVRIVRPGNMPARLAYWRACLKVAQLRGDRREEGVANRELRTLTAICLQVDA